MTAGTLVARRVRARFRLQSLSRVVGTKKEYSRFRAMRGLYEGAHDMADINQADIDALDFPEVEKLLYRLLSHFTTVTQTGFAANESARTVVRRVGQGDYRSIRIGREVLVWTADAVQPVRAK